MTRHSENEPLAKLIEIAGSKAELARALGIGRAAVQRWRRVPDSQVWAVAEEFKVSPKWLRPDISEWRMARLRDKYDQQVRADT